MFIVGSSWHAMRPNRAEFLGQFHFVQGMLTSKNKVEGNFVPRKFR